MANNKPKSSLAEFDFDSEETFFGITAESNQVDNTIKEVKGDEGFDDDDTDFPGQGEKPAKLGSTKLSSATEATPKETKEDADDEDSFFGIGDDDEDEQEEKEEKPKEEKPKEKKKEKPSKKTEEESTEDKEDEDEDEEEDEPFKPSKKDTEEDPENDEEFFTTLASELKDNGIFEHVEVKSGEKITQDRFFELHEEELEARLDEAIEAMAEELDEDGKRFLQFKKNGGKTSDFISVFQANASLDFDKLDMEKPKDRELVMKHYLSTVENLEGEDLEDRLDWLKESGKEKTHSARYLKKLAELDKEAKDKLIEDQANASKAKAENAKKFSEQFTKVLSKADKLGMIPIGKSDAHLGDYVNKPTVKIGKDKYVPKFQVDIAKIFKAETDEDKLKLAAIAKLVNSNFILEDLVTKTQTVVTREAKSNLKAAKAGGKKLKSGGGYGKKSLADFFG